MKTRLIAAVMLVPGFGLWAAPPARAQIASYLDESGRRIYINADNPPARRPVPRAAGFRDQPLPSMSAGQPLRRDVLDRLIQQAAERHKLDPALLRAVIGAESAGNPVAVSRKGALGLMQLVPGTAQRFGVGDAFDPAQNVEAGARYLRELLDRYNGDLSKALAAYNAGEGAVDRSGGVPNYAETRTYVRRVTETYFRPGSDHSSPDWIPLTRPIRKTVDENGRVVFTNE